MKYFITFIFIINILTVSCFCDTNRQYIQSLVQRDARQQTLNAEEYITLGAYCIEKEQYSKGAEYLQKSISLNNNLPISYKLLAMIYEIKKDNTQAIEYWTKYLSFNENLPEESINQANKHIEHLNSKIEN